MLALGMGMLLLGEIPCSLTNQMTETIANDFRLRRNESGMGLKVFTKVHVKLSPSFTIRGNVTLPPPTTLSFLINVVTIN